MMLVLMLAVSRLVPVLLLASVFLVAGRFLFDRYSEQNRALGRVLLVLVILTGSVVLTPFVVRAVSVTCAEAFYLDGKWQLADRFFTLHAKWKGKAQGVLVRDWAGALMSLKHWRKAEYVISTTFKFKGDKIEAEPRLVLLMGICRYYDKNLELAERTFRALTDPQSADNYLRDYFLARLMQKTKREDDALELFAASLGRSPGFLPSLYHLVRLQVLAGDKGSARKSLEDFVRENPGAARDPNIAICTNAVAGQGAPPPDIEFMIIHVYR